MINALLKGYIWLMVIVLGYGAMIGMQEEYERMAAELWCADGEVLVYVWKEDKDGRPVRESARACRPRSLSVPVFFDDTDGQIRRQK